MSLPCGLGLLLPGGGCVSGSLGRQLSSLSGPRWGRFGRGSLGREPWLPITVTCVSLLVPVSGITGGGGWTYWASSRAWKRRLGMESGVGGELGESDQRWELGRQSVLLLSWQRKGREGSSTYGTRVADGHCLALSRGVLATTCEAGGRVPALPLTYEGSESHATSECGRGGRLLSLLA